MKKRIKERTQGGRALKEHLKREQQKKDKLPVKRAPKKRLKKEGANRAHLKKEHAPKEHEKKGPVKKERIQKVLANLGIASRRKIESWILEGRIMVGGKPAELGQRISLKESVTLNGKPIYFEDRLPEKNRIIMYNKPLGFICTREDPEGRPTIFEGLPPIKQGRWVNIGRLDINTSGLMLFTNNGELAHRLMHPSAELEREYAVRVRGTVTPEITKKLVTGVKLEDGVGRFEDIVEAGGEGHNQWFYVVVLEGRNRLVRRLWESQNLEISKLKRVRFGPVMLPKSLKRGAWMELAPDVFSEPSEN